MSSSAIRAHNGHGGIADEWFFGYDEQHNVENAIVTAQNAIAHFN
jgi:hypothetical protein